jgi:hypothetical protein
MRFDVPMLLSWNLIQHVIPKRQFVADYASSRSIGKKIMTYGILIKIIALYVAMSDSKFHKFILVIYLFKRQIKMVYQSNANFLLV